MPEQKTRHLTRREEQIMAILYRLGEASVAEIKRLLPNPPTSGALRRLLANAQFTGRSITLEFAKDALRDMLAAQDKQVTIDNIQKEVADYYRIRTSDLLSSNRSRHCDSTWAAAWGMTWRTLQVF